MPEASGFTLLLLPFAVAAGWYLANRFRPPEETRSVNTDYLRGLQYLVNEEADKAIEVLVNIAGIDNETVETHLALGNLFRRQGQVDRALRIHQNLVARPNLAAKHRNQARYELGRDYLTAGVLDRAEALFGDLVEQGVFLARSLKGLIRIYEQQRDWELALDSLRRLEAAQGEDLGDVAAQYYCELALEALQHDDVRVAASDLKKALHDNRSCARAMIIQGDMAAAAGKFRKAQKDYHQALKARPELASEFIDKLAQCYRERDAEKEWAQVLAEIATASDDARTRIVMAKYLVDAGRPDRAIDFLSDGLVKEPNWRVFAELLRISDLDEDPRFTGMERLRESLQKMVDISPHYRCDHCGFEGGHLHWQCPSCHHWDSQIAIKDIINIGPLAAPTDRVA